MSASIAIEPTVDGHPQAALLRANAAGAPQPYAGHMLDAANELDRMFALMQAGMPPMQRPIDNLYQTISPLADIIGPNPPPVEVSPHAALKHYGGNQTLFHQWVVWKMINEAVATWDTWKQQVDPQPAASGRNR